MTRNPDMPCSVCGKLMWRTKTAASEPICQPCRRVTFFERHTPGVSGYRKGCRCDGCCAARRERNRLQRERQTKVCSTADCDRPLRAKGLCVGCYNRSRRAAGLDGYEWNDRGRDNYHRRRARKQAASTGEPVLLAEIATRDKNRCHICGKRVSDKAWPHPSSPSLDHVVPLSLGGAHAPSNVRLAHLSCNVAKGNRGGGEQLMLVG